MNYRVKNWDSIPLETRLNGGLVSRLLHPLIGAPICSERSHSAFVIQNWASLCPGHWEPASVVGLQEESLWLIDPWTAQDSSPCPGGSSGHGAAGIAPVSPSGSARWLPSNRSAEPAGSSSWPGWPWLAAAHAPSCWWSASVRASSAGRKQRDNSNNYQVEESAEQQTLRVHMYKTNNYIHTEGWLNMKKVRGLCWGLLVHWTTYRTAHTIHTKTNHWKKSDWNLKKIIHIHSAMI